MSKIKKAWLWLFGYRGFTPIEAEEAWERFRNYRIIGQGLNYPEYSADRKLLNTFYKPKAKR